MEQLVVLKMFVQFHSVIYIYLELYLKSGLLSVLEESY